jgi:hypothetical protein
MTIKEFLKKYKWFVIILASIPILTVLVFSLFADIFHRFTLSGGDWAAFIGTILAYIGTALLGVLAFWQNEKTNEINERLLKIEEVKVKPIIDINTIQEAYQFDVNAMKFILQENSIIHYFIISNLSDVYIQSSKLISIKIESYKYKNSVVKINISDCLELQQWNTYILPKEIKRLSIDYSDLCFEKVDIDKPDSRKYELSLRLTTIHGEKYLQKIVFLHTKMLCHQTHNRPEEFVETITDKEISIEEEKK